VNAYPSTTQVTVTVRDLHMSLPYTRLFGAQFGFDEDAGAIRLVARREGDLERH
jgi:hypothetical protein